LLRPRDGPAPAHLALDGDPELVVLVSVGDPHRIAAGHFAHGDAGPGRMHVAAIVAIHAVARGCALVAHLALALLRGVRHLANHFAGELPLETGQFALARPA